jgi:galactokinase
MVDVASGEAPGRVNLIGEHTDYHDGYVLPTVIPQQTHVWLERRDDNRVRACTAAFGNGWEEYALGGETPGRGWLDYVQGVTTALAHSQVAVSGFNVRIQSTVPVGAGVSSSAALEVSLLRGLRNLLGLEVDDWTVAMIAHRAETDFVGAPVGIMDQVVCSLGHRGEALFLDTRTRRVEPLPLPGTMEILVIDSGITHAHAGGEYAERRRESFEAAALLGVARLRDVDSSALARISRLPPRLARRARHIVTENSRVLEAVAALRASDVRRLGALFTASHASMRDDYETSTPEIDVLVEVSERNSEVHGARLTGGGFGGAVVVAANAGAGIETASEICKEYQRRTGRRGQVLVPMRE